MASSAGHSGRRERDGWTGFVVVVAAAVVASSSLFDQGLVVSFFAYSLSFFAFPLSSLCHLSLRCYTAVLIILAGYDFDQLYIVLLHAAICYWQ